MYGRKLHQALCASGLTETAMIIHLVDEDYDRGPIVAALSVALNAGDTPDALEARVKALEPGFFAEINAALARNELQLPSG